LDARGHRPVHPLPFARHWDEDTSKRKIEFYDAVNKLHAAHLSLEMSKTILRTKKLTEYPVATGLILTMLKVAGCCATLLASGISVLKLKNSDCSTNCFPQNFVSTAQFPLMFLH